MKHIKTPYKEKIHCGSLYNFYFEELKAGVLDIETTGLNPAVNKLVLGGLFNNDNSTLHQIFAENKREEAQALREFYEEISKVDMVITYNGRHFDIPFMERRMKTHLGSCPRLPYNLDLYMVLKGHSPIKKLVPNLKQKTVENYMGLWSSRSDEITGAQSVELYNLYERTGDPLLEEKILLHNSDDVIQLTRLSEVIIKSDFHKAMFHMGFPVGNLLIEKIILKRDSLLIKGRQRDKAFDYMGFALGSCPVESRFSSHTGEFHLMLPLIGNSGYTIADLDALGLSEEVFKIYPQCNEGFLVLESSGQNPQKNYMEINHLVKSFVKYFINSI